jgi:hypothetical protein
VQDEYASIPGRQCPPSSAVLDAPRPAMMRLTIPCPCGHRRTRDGDQAGECQGSDGAAAGDRLGLFATSRRPDRSC